MFVAPGRDHHERRHDGPPRARGCSCAGAVLRRACRVGGGAVLRPGVEVGEEAFVAAGAVVTRDVPARAVVMGVPAAPVREVGDEDLLERWRDVSAAAARASTADAPHAGARRRRARRPTARGGVAARSGACGGAARRRCRRRPTDVLRAAEAAVARPRRGRRGRLQRGVLARERAVQPAVVVRGHASCSRAGSRSAARGGAAGPVPNVRVGRRHIHHFVPGIVLAFVSGGAAIVTRDEDARAALAMPLGAGMGLTLDESALLLELEDVYWTREGLLGVQITLAVTALLAALALGLRFLRRGEQLVLRAPDTV